MAHKTKITEGDGDPRHGTSNGYSNLDCRCPLCTEAHRIDHYIRMHKHPEWLDNHARAERLRRQARRSE